uniref:Uncharacterized protein n=1 Tax=Chromera velia CCMP2878 TaxID=1169474 RepID=A0A0G4H2M1_9ALVE|eukprot:Cvel_24398.t1-p1 / transcript=Cvel_24398.t1 / gene=Cvel_24398 / organism=Chromera_velia_CCMP2878 / gene_product=hypothetical protein / transcript_product=hypothetical protein / location=Cvel_scaffold2632:4040-4714(+) / protein_length=225 / sequence_SO=supercontig / SO=protein_coding / is_pseudo=false
MQDMLSQFLQEHQRTEQAPAPLAPKVSPPEPMGETVTVVFSRNDRRLLEPLPCKTPSRSPYSAPAVPAQDDTEATSVVTFHYASNAVHGEKKTESYKTKMSPQGGDRRPTTADRGTDTNDLLKLTLPPAVSLTMEAGTQTKKPSIKDAEIQMDIDDNSNAFLSGAAEEGIVSGGISFSTEREENETIMLDLVPSSKEDDHHMPADDNSESGLPESGPSLLVAATE